MMPPAVYPELTIREEQLTENIETNRIRACWYRSIMDATCQKAEYCKWWTILILPMHRRSHVDCPEAPNSRQFYYF